MQSCPEYSVYHQYCPARLFFERIADKWVLLILYVLASQPLHFNALKRNIEGISPKVLSQKLKMLERDGFVSRHVQIGTPIRVDYQLTTLGQEVYRTTCQLKTWAESNIESVLIAQQQYDVQQK